MLAVLSTVESSVMRIRNLVLLSLLILVPVVSLAVKKFNTVTEDSQNTLTVIRFEDHISIQCNPASSETSSRTEWKAICNEMAIPQINKLVADGAIEEEPTASRESTPTKHSGPNLVGRGSISLAT